MGCCQTSNDKDDRSKNYKDTKPEPTTSINNSNIAKKMISSTKSTTSSTTINNPGTSDPPATYHIRCLV